MNLYAESSAVLSWLFESEESEQTQELLSTAEIVVDSDLTLVECARVLVRSVHTRRLSELEAARLSVQLNQAASHWVLLRPDAEILERARRPFPVEPIRTLDALHIASALAALRAVPNIALLSLDQGVRRCGVELGFEIVPA